MNKLIVLILIAFCCFRTTRAEDPSYTKVECVPLAPNKVVVRLNRATTKEVLNAYNKANGNVAVFRSFVKDKLKNIDQQNHACIFGSVGEEDYNTATAMFSAGHEEFAFKAAQLEFSNYAFLYMVTERGKAFSPAYNHFQLGN